ncbi:hypothetical protein BaRGS_00015679 [Batillaria attramentaria]|uniref:Uncharacterized protein n=1 Tax=Batillaria attramentaria TaxID=370345 RepID=A0ABD0L1R0_9CAEN
MPFDNRRLHCLFCTNSQLQSLVAHSRVAVPSFGVASQIRLLDGHPILCRRHETRPRLCGLIGFTPENFSNKIVVNFICSAAGN